MQRPSSVNASSLPLRACGMAQKRSYAEEVAFIEQVNGHAYRCVPAREGSRCLRVAGGRFWL